MKTIIVAFGLLLFSPIAFSANTKKPTLEELCKSLNERRYSTSPKIEYIGGLNIEHAPGRFIVRACKVKAINGKGVHVVVEISNRPTPSAGPQYAVEPEDLKKEVRLANAVELIEIERAILTRKNKYGLTPNSDTAASAIADNSPAEPKPFPATPAMLENYPKTVSAPTAI